MTAGSPSKDSARHRGLIPVSATLSQVWGQFAFEQIEEIGLVAANLHKDQVVEARGR